MNRKTMGLVLGPLMFLYLFFFTPFEGLNDRSIAALAATVWVVIWWITEALPLPVTALLPIVILPMSGGASVEKITAVYGDKMLFLFVGGFIVAIAMQKWNLHKRIALSIVYTVGTDARYIVLGFMLATGFLSMWISNTATTLMMVTIAGAMIHEVKSLSQDTETRSFFKVLLLGICYSASIGGVATLVGTPTNPIFVAIADQMYGIEFSFSAWISFALPFSATVLWSCWIILTRIVYKVDKFKIPLMRSRIKAELKQLGKPTQEEKAVALVFFSMAVLWMTRSLIFDPLFSSIDDAIIAIGASSFVFLIRSKKTGKPLLSWEEAERLPWGIIMLFGGGLSIAATFQSSGLTVWLGQQLIAFRSLPLFLIILLITLAVNFLTEITTNVTTASIMLPVLTSLAEVIGVHPFLLMVPATMAASCAFMLPIATAPNAIVYSSDVLEIKDMVKSGVWLNLISSLLIALLVYLILPGFLQAERFELAR